jgi:hypothetical protein
MNEMIVASIAMIAGTTIYIISKESEMMIWYLHDKFKDALAKQNKYINELEETIDRQDRIIDDLRG